MKTGDTRASKQEIPTAAAALDGTRTPPDSGASGSAPRVNGRNGEGAPRSERSSVEAGIRTPADSIADERDDVLSVINELEDQLDRYEEIRESLERELGAATEECQTARQRVQELEWQVVTLQTRLDTHEQVRQEVSLLEQELAEANTRVQRLNERVVGLEDENARLNNELKTNNKQLEEMWAIRKERDGLRSDSKTMRARVDQLERCLRETTEERNAMQLKLTETQTTLEDIRSAKHQVEMELKTTQDQGVELRRAQEGLEQKLEAHRAEKRTLAGQLTHLERENARLVEQQQFYERELTSLRAVNRNADAALSNVKKAFSEVRIALAETKARARRRTLETWPRIASVLDVGGEPGSIREPSAESARMMVDTTRMTRPAGEPETSGGLATSPPRSASLTPLAAVAVAPKKYIETD